MAAKFESALRRYFTRKIGFEAVMRIRCTRGLALHTFHGNFFVRSTDLLSLPNINPDAGFGMQVSICLMFLTRPYDKQVFTESAIYGLTCIL